MMQDRLSAYFATLGRLPLAAEVTDHHGQTVTLAQFFDRAIADRVRADNTVRAFCAGR